MSNLALVGYNKGILCCSAPGSNHDDVRLLRNTKIYRDILAGEILPNKGIDLGEMGKIPLVTTGDSAFPKHSWLIKVFNEKTKDPMQRHFNKKLCSARVVSENVFGKLKGRFRFLYKKTECRLRNLRYIILACVLLPYICLKVNDPCLPRWKLEVKHLDLIKLKQIGRNENTKASESNRACIDILL